MCAIRNNCLSEPIRESTRHQPSVPTTTERLIRRTCWCFPFSCHEVRQDVVSPRHATPLNQSLVSSTLPNTMVDGNNDVPLMVAATVVTDEPEEHVPITKECSTVTTTTDTTPAETELVVTPAEIELVATPVETELVASPTRVPHRPPRRRAFRKLGDLQ